MAFSAMDGLQRSRSTALFLRFAITLDSWDDLILRVSLAVKSEIAKSRLRFLERIGFFYLVVT